MMEPSGASSSSLPPVPPGMSRREYRKYIAGLQAQQPAGVEGAGVGEAGPEASGGRAGLGESVSGAPRGGAAHSEAPKHGDRPKSHSEFSTGHSPTPGRREWRAQQTHAARPETPRPERPSYETLRRSETSSGQAVFGHQPPSAIQPMAPATPVRVSENADVSENIGSSETVSVSRNSAAARPMRAFVSGSQRPARSGDSGYAAAPESGQFRRASTGGTEHGNPRHSTLADNVVAFHRPQRLSPAAEPAEPAYAPVDPNVEPGGSGGFEFAEGRANQSGPARGGVVSAPAQRFGRPVRVSTMGQPQVANPFQRPMAVAPVPTSQMDEVAPAEVVDDSFQPVVWTHLEGDTSVRSRRDLRNERSKQATKITRKFLDRKQYMPKLPKASMVGALGVAAVLTPFMMQNAANIAGEGANAQTLIVTNPQDVSADVPNPAVIPAASGEQAEMASPIIDEAESPVLDPESLVASRLAAEEASQEFNRNPLPGCDPSHVTAGNENGRLDTDQLCALWQNGHRLRADAAVALARLNEEYTARFGDTITVTDSYRSYSQQVAVRRKKPGLAAAPGTSEHGWGLAVDMADGVPNVGERYIWLREVAPKYGWDNPEWARKGGSGAYEPWHWEYTPTDENA